MLSRCWGEGEFTAYALIFACGVRSWQFTRREVDDLFEIDWLSRWGTAALSIEINIAVFEDRSGIEVGGDC